MIHKSNIHSSKIHEEELKNNLQFPLEHKKIGRPRHLSKFSIWKGRLSILDKDNQLNRLRIKRIHIILNKPILYRRISCCID